MRFNGEGAVKPGLTSASSNVLFLFIDTPPPPLGLDLSQPCELSGQSEARASRQMRMLQELAEIGMQLARAVGRQIADRVPEDPGGGDADLAPDLALVFSRISRAVRQTIALEARLDRQLHEARAAEDAAKAEHARIATRTLVRRRKHTVREAVQDAVDAEACGPELEVLLADLDERLDDSDDNLDFAELPVGQLVARICRQLGVTPDPGLWQDEEPEVQDAREPPGSHLRGSQQPSLASDLAKAGGADGFPRILEHPPP